MRPTTTIRSVTTIYQCERCGARGETFRQTRNDGKLPQAEEMPLPGILVAAPLQLLVNGVDCSTGEGYYCDERCLTADLADFLKAKLAETDRS